MSKMDNLRAMREARYAEMTKRSAAAGAAKTVAARKTPPVAPPVPTVPDPAPTEPALCGHRNMSGRTCTREQGHTAKNHRYS